MVIGEMDRRIQLGTYTTAKNLSGEDVRTWSWSSAIWANVKTDGGQEVTQAAQLVGESVAVFVIRYRTGYDQSKRLKYNSKEYDILSIDEIERKEYLSIKAKKQDNE